MIAYHVDFQVLLLSSSQRDQIHQPGMKSLELTRKKNTHPEGMEPPYLESSFKNLGCPSILSASLVDHVHSLFLLSRTRSVAEVVKEVKLKTG